MTIHFNLLNFNNSSKHSSLPLVTSSFTISRFKLAHRFNALFQRIIPCQIINNPAPLTAGVHTHPGLTALTLMPSADRSSAMPLVMAAIAPLLAA